MVKVHDLTKPIRDMIQVVAGKLGLRTVSKVREGENAILRRTTTAVEQAKMLAQHPNHESGKFKMVCSCLGDGIIWLP